MQSLTQRTKLANSMLADYATPHAPGLGRRFPEKADGTRFPFQRDRDRIIHTQAFRRLKHKTQVFVTGQESSDHYRTRLTHTMEVAQIGRDMARTLSLNEDLAECIALAHDLGHTPFGHAGEEAMNEEMRRFHSSFEHNRQSLRIVTLLEVRSGKYNGLNLNREILEGMMKHRTSFDKCNIQHVHRSPSLEAQVVNLADEIAYTAHDVDDGMRSEIISEDGLAAIALFAESKALSEKNDTDVRGSIIHILVVDAYAETERRISEFGISSLGDVYASEHDVVSFSDGMADKLRTLRKYLQDNFYAATDVVKHSNRGKQIIKSLFQSYENSPPGKVVELMERTGSCLHEAVKDYIAGMTDGYAVRRFTALRR